MTNLADNHRFQGNRNHAIYWSAAETPQSLGPLIPIALLTGFMLLAVINPMW